MAVYNMQKPSQRPVGNSAIGYNKPRPEAQYGKPISAKPLDSIGYNKPGNAQEYAKPINTRPPVSSKPIGASPISTGYQLPPMTTQPIGNPLIGQAQAVKPGGQFTRPPVQAKPPPQVNPGAPGQTSRLPWWYRGGGGSGGQMSTMPVGNPFAMQALRQNFAANQRGFGLPTMNTQPTGGFGMQVQPQDQQGRLAQVFSRYFGI
jgi:hypothetical protein